MGDESGKGVESAARSHQLLLHCLWYNILLLLICVYLATVILGVVCGVGVASFGHMGQRGKRGSRTGVSLLPRPCLPTQNG